MGWGNVFMRIVKCRQFPSSRSETEGLWTNKELTLSVHLQWEAQQSWYVNAWHKGVIFIKSVFIDFLYSQDMTSSCTCIFIPPSSQASRFISASLMLRNAHKTQNSFKPSWDTPTHFRQLWNTEFSFHLQCWVSYLWKNVSNDRILMKIVSKMMKLFLPTFNQCSESILTNQFSSFSPHVHYCNVTKTFIFSVECQLAATQTAMGLQPPRDLTLRTPSLSSMTHYSRRSGIRPGKSDALGESWVERYNKKRKWTQSIFGVQIFHYVQCIYV